MPDAPKRGRPAFTDPGEVRNRSARFRLNAYEWAEVAEAFGGGDDPDMGEVRDYVLAAARRRNARSRRS